jgi:hypothetical protein
LANDSPATRRQRATAPSIPDADLEWPRDFSTEEQNKLRELAKATVETLPDQWRDAQDSEDLGPVVEALKAAASATDERPRPDHIWEAVLKELRTCTQDTERRKKKRTRKATTVADGDEGAEEYEQPAGPKQTRKRRRVVPDEEDEEDMVL